MNIQLINARILRIEAEQTARPELYEKAAAEFEQIGMTEAARRCRDRAVHYRSDIVFDAPRNSNIGALDAKELA